MEYSQRSSFKNTPKSTKDKRSDYLFGVTLVVISAMLFSSAGIFTKGVVAGSWEVIFWRGAFAAVFTIVWIIWRGTLVKNFARMGASGLAVAIIGAMGTAAFIAAFKFTTIANVSLIYAASPLLAALIAWLWIGEPISRQVVMGCLGAILGVAIVVGGSFNNLNLTGDILALLMTAALALIMVIYRRYPNTPAAGPMALSSLILLPVSFFLGTPLIIETSEIIALAAFGLVFAIASVTLAEGSKHIPPGEAALLSILETPVAPLLAWLIFTEIPADTTFMGGALILAAVIGTQVSRKRS